MQTKFLSLATVFVVIVLTSVTAKADHDTCLLACGGDPVCEGNCPPDKKGPTPPVMMYCPYQGRYIGAKAVCPDCPKEFPLGKIPGNSAPYCMKGNNPYMIIVAPEDGGSLIAALQPKPACPQPEPVKPVKEESRGCGDYQLYLQIFESAIMLIVLATLLVLIRSVRKDQKK